MILQGVVFDVDGVLFDSERLMHQVWKEVSVEVGYPDVWKDYLEYVGIGRDTIFQKMLSLYGPEFPKEAFLTACSQRLQEHMERDGVPLKPGVVELLEFLSAHNIPVALATSTASVRTLRRLELTGLEHYFKAAITGDQVKRGKPAPDIYLMACEALGTDPAHTLAVEDSRNGILSASSAGMPVVMVPDMIPPTPELDALLWKRLSSLVELRDVLAIYSDLKKTEI